MDFSEEEDHDPHGPLHGHDQAKPSPSAEDLRRFPPDLLLSRLRQVVNGSADQRTIDLIRQAVAKGIIDISVSHEFQGVTVKVYELETVRDIRYAFADEVPCHYVKDATNHMYALLNGARPEDHLLEVARTGYNTVTRLIDDPDFQAIVAKAESLQEENRSDCLSFVKEVQHFAEFFLSTEWAVLVMGGVDRQAALDMVKQAKQLRLATLSILERGDGNILGGLRRLRAQLDLLVRVLTKSRREELNQARIKQTLLKITFALGGASAVVLNTTVGTILLSNAGSAVSGVVGDALIQAAVKGD